jgi:hypothetical protein
LPVLTGSLYPQHPAGADLRAWPPAAPSIVAFVPSVQPVRIEYAGAVEQGRHFEVADFQSIEAGRLIMMLGLGRQGCVQIGDNAGQRCHESGGEAERLSLEHVSTPDNC